jgi:hypothetical protein
MARRAVRRRVQRRNMRSESHMLGYSSSPLNAGRDRAARRAYRLGDGIDMRSGGGFAWTPPCKPATSGQIHNLMSQDHPRSSHQRYRRFVQDYRHKRLDEAIEALDKKGNGVPARTEESGSARPPRSLKRRQYLRAYANWLWPHR